MPESKNILGTMPVGRLVLHMSWPIMISMLVQAVYNLVDSIFVARISDKAFLALSYAYPIQTLMVAFCVGIGVAFSAILSKRLGERDLPGARDAVFHGFALYAGCWVLFFLFGALGVEAYLAGCTEDQAVREMGIAYLRLCCCCSFGVCTQFPLERILQSTGHPAGFMIIQGSGAVINLILDPVLIFGYGPFPEMGVAGAALATVIGQIIAAIISAVLNLEELRRRRCDPSRNYPVMLRNEVYRKIYEKDVYEANQFLGHNPKDRASRESRSTIRKFLDEDIFVAPEKVPDFIK